MRYKLVNGLLQNKNDILDYLQIRCLNSHTSTVNEDLSVDVDAEFVIPRLEYLEQSGELDEMQGFKQLPFRLKSAHSISINETEFTTLKGIEDVDNQMEDFEIFIGGLDSLSTLDFLPKTIAALNVQSCGITDVGDTVSKIGKLLINECNNLVEIRNCPNLVDLLVLRRNDKLSKLSSLPEKLKHFVIGYNQSLLSLEGIQDLTPDLESIEIVKTPIASHVLGLLFIPGLNKISGWDNRVGLAKAMQLMQKTIDDKKSPFDCQNEMIDAKLDNLAEL